MLAIFPNGVLATMLVTYTILFDVCTTRAVPLEVFVSLFRISTTSGLLKFVLNLMSLFFKINLFTLSPTKFSTEVLSKNGYKTVFGLKSVPTNNTLIERMKGTIETSTTLSPIDCVIVPGTTDVAIPVLV